MKMNKYIILTLFSSLAFVGCKKNPASRGYEYAPEMYHALAYEPYRQGETEDLKIAFKDGNAMQLPPPGTMARGQWNSFQYNDSLSDKERATKELVNPLEASPENLAEGEVLFVRYCAVCHGTSGKGDGSVPTVTEGKYPPPPKYKSRAELSAGRIFYIMTYGQNSMGSYSYALSQGDRWKVAHYVGKLQDELNPAAAVEAPADSGKVTAAAPAKQKGKN